MCMHAVLTYCSLAALEPFQCSPLICDLFINMYPALRKLSHTTTALFKTVQGPFASASSSRYYAFCLSYVGATSSYARVTRAILGGRISLGFHPKSTLRAGLRLYKRRNLWQNRMGNSPCEAGLKAVQAVLGSAHLSRPRACEHERLRMCVRMLL